VNPATTCQHVLTGVRCYYDQERHRQQRPHCQGVATVAHGPTVLCANCDKMRSTVGKGTAPRPAPGAALARLAHAARPRPTPTACSPTPPAPPV